MIKVGDWVKEYPNSSEIIKITKLNENDSTGLGYAYRLYNRYAVQVEINTKHLVKISPEDVLEKVFDEVLELRDDLRKLQDVDSMK